MFLESMRSTDTVLCPVCGDGVYIYENYHVNLKDMPLWKDVEHTCSCMIHRYRCNSCQETFTEEIPFKYGRLVLYDYFCIQAKEMLADHFEWSMNPEQAIRQRDYFTSNKLVVSSERELLLLFSNQLKNGQDVFLKVSKTWHPFDCEKEIMRAINTCQTNIRGYTYSYNPVQGICYLRADVGG